MNSPNETVQSYEEPLKLSRIFTRAFWKAWHNRAGGGRDVLRMAVPIIVSYSSVVVMTTTDRLCLAWYGRQEMNAAFQAGALFWAFLFLPQGVGAFVNTFVAQYFGANQNKRIGSVVWQGLFIGLFCGLFFVAATPLIGPLFRWIGQSESSSTLEQTYWKYLAWGTIATLGLEPFVSFFNGIRETKIVMKITILGFVVNMVLDPILIFGIGGRLRYGVAGAALATSIALWLKFAVFLCAAWKRDAKGEFALRKSVRFDPPEMKRLVKFGSMSAIQTTAEHWFYTLFVLMMGWIGEEANAATAIAYNLNGLVYMPAVGFGVATAALVGNYVGAKDFERARRATRTSLALSSVVAGVFSVAFLIFPDPFVDVYTLFDPESYATARPIAINILRIVGLYLLLDAYNLILSSALRGAR
ncbi:MAG: MATE family efflux transporter, partial [Thermoguttaceae bacterium]|nr:MATE family efflux transporter [Thermoguttaceae bacterium]